MLPYFTDQYFYYPFLGLFAPIDSKREEFRRYLERAGVMDALTKVLVSLYEEPDKPEDALEYVRKHLGTDGGEDELEAARARIAELEAENALLKGETAPAEG
ncbi:C-Myc-binding protein [Papilio machaon]|uniref:c-Myc-binding protein n=1 Tax=Papilio machaon TaxID=76193 RepID=A0A194RQM3_PAPMA|nr:C-Myc-binding protein [Papilio machaon]